MARKTLFKNISVEVKSTVIKETELNSTGKRVGGLLTAGVS